MARCQTGRKGFGGPEFVGALLGSDWRRTMDELEGAEAEVEAARELKPGSDFESFTRA